MAQDDGLPDNMQIPQEFEYREVFLKGRPRHDKSDSFYAKHPPMPASRWAKIFSPFDALRGFGSAIASKECQYTDKRLPGEELQQDLDRKLSVLHNLTVNSREARKNLVQAAVTCYTPCTDQRHEAYGHRGRYVTHTGTVWNVDLQQNRTIRIDDHVISLDDIYEIEIIHNR